MTDRLNALTIVLENNIREDDAQALISAISMLRGVLSVDVNVADINAHVAEKRVRREVLDSLIKLANSEPISHHRTN